MAHEPGKIRNVAVVGHRGTGKTSLVEAMLFQAGATNRLGTIEAGSTVSDWDEDEQRRNMSLAASVCHARVAGPQDQPDRHARRRGLRRRRDRRASRRRGRALRRQRRHGRRGADGAQLDARRRRKPLARPLREHARPRARRLLPRPRRAAGAAVRALRRHPPADRRGARADRHRRPPAHVRLHEPRRPARGQGRWRFPPSCRRRSTSTTRSSSTPSSRPTRSSWSATSTARSCRSRRSRTR